MSEIIISGKWLGIENLVIPPDLLSLVAPSKNTPEAFWSLPTDVFKSESFREGAKRVNKKLPQMENYPDIAIQCTWELFRTANSVNKSFNSKTYSTVAQLQSIYNSWMNKLKFGFWENRTYDQIIIGYNRVYDIPSVTAPLAFSGSELLPVPTPGTGDLHLAISKLAELFISMFKFASGIAEMVRLAVIGVVSKVVHINGASAIKYAIAKLLKGGSIPLPPAEAGNAAWSLLMQYGGYIVAISILVVLAYQLSKKPPVTATDILLTYEKGWESHHHNPIREDEFLAQIFLDSANPVFNDNVGLMKAFLLSDEEELVGAFEQKSEGNWDEIEDVEEAEKVFLEELLRFNLRIGSGKWYKIN